MAPNNYKPLRDLYGDKLIKPKQPTKLSLDFLQMDMDIEEMLEDQKITKSITEHLLEVKGY